MRVVGIPKPGGGTRPLGIACVAWRVGMSHLVRCLMPWAAAWLPAELVGGVRGRSAADLHDHIGARLHAAVEEGRELCGVSIDLRKCFDCVVPRVALRVWGRVGAPPALLRVLECFYSLQQRWIEFRGAVCTAPVRCQRSLLQG